MHTLGQSHPGAGLEQSKPHKHAEAPVVRRGCAFVQWTCLGTFASALIAEAII